MPSQLHEVLIDMFRDRPSLAADLLGGPLGVDLPTFQKAQLSAGDLTDIAPTEYRADTVVTLDADDGPAFAVVVEVQLRTDPRKRYSWPVYVATLHARLKCPVVLLVLCTDPRVAAWCSTPVVIGNPGLVLTPVILGPRQVPLVTDVRVARAQPELAVLSTLAHGTLDDPSPLLTALMAALEEVDQERARMYTDLVAAELPTAARALLEDMMTTAPYEFRSDFMNRVLDHGVAKGEAIGEAKAVVLVLESRNVALTDEDRRLVLECTDTARLQEWIRKAAVAETIDDVLR